MKQSALVIAAVALAASLASAGTISYTCDPTIDATTAGTCAYLNSTVAGYYSSSFTNANANIYIKMGTTGLGSSTSGFLNLINYSTYLADLTATASGDAIDTATLASLPGIESALYDGGQIEVTSALGAALGIPNSSLSGTTAGGASCQPGTSGCYNGIITVTTPANLSSESGGTQSLYWNQTGGSQPATAYDFYSVVEHETDELLGSASCITTSGSLADGCGGSNASAVDLFRYAGSGTPVFIDTTPGAYFSYNSGATNGAAGAAYNTLANGNDYADFATNCQHVQDAMGCLGTEFDITNDGGAEINILDAVGYNASAVSAAPEPGTMLLLSAGLALVLGIRTRLSEPRL
jgi:hypothetical protein